MAAKSTSPKKSILKFGILYSFGETRNNLTSWFFFYGPSVAETNAYTQFDLALYVKKYYRSSSSGIKALKFCPICLKIDLLHSF